MTAAFDDLGYCLVPPDGTLVIVDDSSGGLLQACQGDCDDDSECADGLKCFIRGGNEPVPGCESANSGIGAFGDDYCFDATGYIILVGNNYDPLDAFPLGVCEGDCDTSFDCAGDLICFGRNSDEQVPGCEDPYNDITVHGGNDFCCDPNVDGCTATLTFVGNNEDDVFPLEICEGDCDTDDDCARGLRCFQRNETNPVPGCRGDPFGNEDYCFDPTGIMVWVSTDNGTTAIQPFAEKDAMIAETGLGVCQGDCDRSSDCAEDLVCYRRDPGENAPVPGCILAEGEIVLDDIDFCCDPNVPNCSEGDIDLL